jgi:hypothetical protein
MLEQNGISIASVSIEITETTRKEKSDEKWVKN